MWRLALRVLGACLQFFCDLVLFILFQRNRPEDVGLPPIEQYHNEPEAVLVEGEAVAAESDGAWSNVKAVLRNRMILLLAAVYFLIKPTRYL